jgi:TIR domain-containing protein
MAYVFINYRSGSQSGYALLIDLALRLRLGADAVFLDQRSLRPGDDFAVTIMARLRRSTAVLALVGHGWPGPMGAHDWVVAELAEALARDIRVVPLLLDGAALPPVLPAGLAALRRYQAMVLRPGRADADLAGIVCAIGRLLGGGPGGGLRVAAGRAGGGGDERGPRE